MGNTINNISNFISNLWELIQDLFNYTITIGGNTYTFWNILFTLGLATIVLVLVIKTLT